MDFAPEFVHETAGHFRIPIIDAGKEREDGSGRDDVMEMRDDVVSVVQMQIDEAEAERETGQTADAEHWEEREDEKHRRGEADRAAPQRDEEHRQNDD